MPESKTILLSSSPQRYEGTTSPCIGPFLPRRYPDWAARFEASTLKLSSEGTCDRGRFPMPFLWRLFQMTRCLLWNHNHDPKIQTKRVQLSGWFCSVYLFHDFRCHPTRSPDKRVPHFLPRQISSGCQPGWYTKICNLNSSVFSQENVSGFYIPKIGYSSPMETQFKLLLSCFQTCVFVRCYGNTPAPSKPHAEQ